MASSPGRRASPMKALNCSVLATRLLCDSAAPLESPVVPPVYCRNKRSAPVTGTGVNLSDAPCLRASANETAFVSLSSTAGAGSTAAVASAGATLMTCFTGVLPMTSASVDETPLKMIIVNPGIVELMLELLRRVERIDIDLHGAGADDADYGDRKRRDVWQHH